MCFNSRKRGEKNKNNAISFRRGNVEVFQNNNAKAERKTATFNCGEKCKEII